MSTRAGGPEAEDAGVGLVSTLVGFVVLLGFLLLAVQVTIDMFARSFVASVAYDAANVVAGSDAGGSAESIAAADARGRQELGQAGRDARFAWTVTANEVQVTISLRERDVLPALLARPLGLDTVVRAARVRRERVR